MVRKIIIVMAAVSMLLSLMTVHAMAAEPYADGNISTTYITIYRDIANNIGINDDYVFFRSGQYEYKMYVGDLENLDSTFTGTELTCYTITTNSGTTYNSTYTYDITTGETLTLTCGDILVYSNLGGYPNFFERGDNNEVALLLLGGVAFVCFLISRIFSFNLRRRV